MADPTTLPAVLAAGDGITWPLQTALEVARHLRSAQVLLTGTGPVTDDLLLERLALFLGGDHWVLVADELMTALEQEDQAAVSALMAGPPEGAGRALKKPFRGRPDWKLALSASACLHFGLDVFQGVMQPIHWESASPERRERVRKLVHRWKALTSDADALAESIRKELEQEGQTRG